MAEASRDSSGAAPSVRRAVVPAAGRGTRMQAVAGALPKELLPIGGRPLLVHALADLAAGGIEEALVIVSPEKPQIAAALGDACAGVRLRYALQPTPRGLADALSLAEEFAAGGPLFCWLPDNHWRRAPGARSATAQLLAAHAAAPDATLVALLEHATATFDPASSGSAGFIEWHRRTGAAAHAPVAIDRVHAKGAAPPPRGTTFLKGFPMTLWSADLFARIAALRRDPPPGELDDTPLLMALAREGRLGGAVLRDGALFDCGVPLGYARACAAASS